MEVANVRRNHCLGKNRAVLETRRPGELRDAELKAVHLQIPSEGWLSFAEDLRTAIHEVAAGLGGSMSGTRQKNSYLLDLTTSRCSCFAVAAAAFWTARCKKYPRCVEALSLLFLRFFTTAGETTFAKFALGPIAETFADCFVHQFGQQFLVLCSRMRVSPNCESMRVLPDTRICDSNIDIAEHETLRRVTEATHAHARLRMQHVPNTDSTAYGSPEGPKLSRLR